MGTQYYIGCKDCKVVRALGKFWISGGGVETRKDVIELEKEIVGNEHGSWSFMSALLVSFMAEHRDHDCMFFHEHNEEISPYYNEEYKIDTNFWR